MQLYMSGFGLLLYCIHFFFTCVQPRKHGHLPLHLLQSWVARFYARRSRLFLGQCEWNDWLFNFSADGHIVGPQFADMATILHCSKKCLMITLEPWTLNWIYWIVGQKIPHKCPILSPNFERKINVAIGRDVTNMIL